MAKSRNENVRVMVLPATDNAHKEGFVKVNGKVIPFGVPVVLHEQDVKAINNIREPKRVDSGVNVYDLMDKLKITQEKANKLLRENEDMRTNASIRYIKKYNVVKI